MATMNPIPYPSSFSGWHTCKLCGGPGSRKATGGRQEEKQGRHGSQAIPHQGPPLPPLTPRPRRI